MSSLVMFNGKLVGGSTGIAVFDGGQPPQPPEHTVTIDGVVYPTVTIGNQEWLAEDLRCVISSDTYIWEGHTNYGYYYSAPELHTGINALLESSGLTGWHVPTQADMTELLTFIKNDKGYSSLGDVYQNVFLTSETSRSDDCYGLGLTLCGSWDGRSSYNRVTDAGSYCNLGEDSGTDSYPDRVYISAAGHYGNGSEAITRKYCVRLVKNNTASLSTTSNASPNLLMSSRPMTLMMGNPAGTLNASTPNNPDEPVWDEQNEQEESNLGSGGY